MYEKTLKEQFSHLNIDNFNVDLSNRFLFLCGGPVDVKLGVPQSFRDRLLSYTASKKAEYHDTFILAETFKDYFRENTYPDLLVFEDDIASISSLIIIFLESPGSLVELGLFCNKREYYKKLLIIAPYDEVQYEDSFIYLGPLEYIKKKNSTSVLTYPWPSKDEREYDNNILEDLCKNIEEKIGGLSQTEQFNKDISGHIALLICQIISVCFPIQLSEVESAIETLKVGKLTQSVISRYLYLLQKMGLIGLFPYSSNKYYYPLYKDKIYVKFGKDRNDVPMDMKKIFMNIRQSFIMLDDSLSIRRCTALKQINSRLKASGK